MRTFAKLGLLLALIVAGRYLRLTESTTFAAQQVAATRVVKADTLRFASYASTRATLPVAPVSQRSQAANPPGEPTFLVWY